MLVYLVKNFKDLSTGLFGIKYVFTCSNLVLLKNIEMLENLLKQIRIYRHSALVYRWVREVTLLVKIIGPCSIQTGPTCALYIQKFIFIISYRS